MTIVEFLEARFDEDEQRVRYVHEYGDTGGLFTPARALAELKAKRHVLEVLRSYEPSTEWYVYRDMGERGNNAAGAVRVMAAVYKDHPDYRAEWAV